MEQKLEEFCARDSEPIINMPIEIANDNYLRAYKEMDGDKVVKYYKRKPDLRDIQPIIERGELIIKGVYFGEWEDHTIEYIEQQTKIEAQRKAERALQRAKEKDIELTDEEYNKIVEEELYKSYNRQNRPGTSQTKEEIRKRELEKAEKLLAELLLNNETPTEKQLQKLQKASILEKEATND